MGTGISELLHFFPSFDKDEGGGGGGGDDETTTTDNANGGGNSGEDRNEGGESAVTMSQDDFTRKIVAAKEQAKRSAFGELLEELGVEDVGTLKTLARAQQERQEAEKSELEKAQTEQVKLEEKLKREREQNRNLLIRSAVQSAVADEGLRFHSMDDVFKHVDLSGVEVDDDGKVTGAVEAVKALAKSKPYLIKAEEGAPDIDAREGGDGGSGAGSDDEREKELRGRYHIGN